MCSSQIHFSGSSSFAGLFCGTVSYKSQLFCETVSQKMTTMFAIGAERHLLPAFVTNCETEASDS